MRAGSGESASALNGKTIILTAAEATNQKYKLVFEKAGATVLMMPLIKLEPQVDNLRNFFNTPTLFQYNWLFFTSKNAVNFFFQALRQSSPNQLEANQKIAVIGPATGQVLKRSGYQADFISSKSGAQFMADEFVKSWTRNNWSKASPPTKILLVLGELADHTLQQRLADGLGSEISITRLNVYKTESHLVTGKEEKNAGDLIRENDYDLILLKSPSALRSLLERYSTLDKNSFKCASVGPTTSSAMQRLGMTPLFTAARPTPESVLKLALNYFSDRP